MSLKIIILLNITFLLLLHCQYVPTESDQKCIHKEETRFNQKIPIESPALRVVLKRYEELHREATTTTNIKEAFLGDKNIKYKYMYMQQGGL